MSVYRSIGAAAEGPCSNVQGSPFNQALGASSGSAMVQGYSLFDMGGAPTGSPCPVLVRRRADVQAFLHDRAQTVAAKPLATCTPSASTRPRTLLSGEDTQKYSKRRRVSVKVTPLPGRSSPISIPPHHLHSIPTQPTCTQSSQSTTPRAQARARYKPSKSSLSRNKMPWGGWGPGLRPDS